MQGLTGEDLELAQNRINEAEPGQYELREIIGELWEAIAKPNHWGQRFKQSVKDGDLQGINSLGRNVKNHQVYQVTSPRSGRHLGA